MTKLVLFCISARNLKESTDNVYEKYVEDQENSIKYAYNYNRFTDEILVVEYANQNPGDPYFTWEGDLYMK